MPATPLLLLLLCSLYFPSLSQRVKPCGSFCSFQLCNNNGTLFPLPLAAFSLFGIPRLSTAPFICRSDRFVQFILATGEARVFDKDHFVPLSKWRPSGLNKPFRKDAIQAIDVKPFGLSGIGRGRKSVGNQWRFLHDRCMVLPILKYAVTGADGVVTQVNTRGGAADCVSFRITAPELHVQLNWANSDDMDLSAEEPDGEFIDSFDTRSANGRLLGDNSNKFCARNLPVGKEDIVWFPGRAEKGLHIVEVKHIKSCDERKDTPYVVRIIKNGKLFREWKAIAKDASENLVLNRTFRN